MDIVKKEDFDDIELTEKDREEISKGPTISKEELNLIINSLQQPVEIQKELAAKLKGYIDFRMETELEKFGVLNDSTRRWVEVYNDLLAKIHKALHGDKSVSLHMHKISHADINKEVRKYVNIKKVKGDVQDGLGKN